MIQSWKNSSLNDYTNNPDGTTALYVNETWDTTANEWVNNSKSSVTCKFPVPPGVAAGRSVLTLYPNPAGNTLTIAFAGGVPGFDRTAYSISDLQVRILKRSTFTGEETSVNLRQLPANICILKLERGDQTETRKLLK